jgi:hypothetical protein
VGSDLDEVEVLLTGDALRVAQSKDAQLRSIDADESTGLRSDLLVDARSIGSGYLLHLPLVHGQAIKNPRAMTAIGETRPTHADGSKLLCLTRQLPYGAVQVGAHVLPRF